MAFLFPIIGVLADVAAAAAAGLAEGAGAAAAAAAGLAEGAGAGAAAAAGLAEGAAAAAGGLAAGGLANAAAGGLAAGLAGGLAGGLSGGLAGLLAQKKLKEYLKPVSPVSPDDKVEHYVECAFTFNDGMEAFLFIADKCLQINFAPNDYSIKGPISICDFFPSLRNTIFAEGINSAFTSSAKNEVYMFRNNLCVLLNFVTGDIIAAPKKITDCFNSLKGTIFEDGIDAAFASHQSNEVYIFKGDQYALLKFTDDCLLIHPQKITIGFPSLSGTIFADGLNVAFRSTTANEAYIFKGDTYALINYAQGTNCIIDIRSATVSTL